MIYFKKVSSSPSDCRRYEARPEQSGCILASAHTGTRFAYVYDYVTKLCSRQAEVILNHENPNVHAIGQGGPRHRKYKRLNLVAVKPTTVQVSNCRFLGLNKFRHRLLHYPALTDVPVYSTT
jgi:hypothetical protein